MKLRKTSVEIEGQVQERWILVEGEDLEAWTGGEDLRFVGKPRPRIDGPERVSGRARFTCDVDLPGMLHARFLRSPHAHARLVACDLEAIRRRDGVVAAWGPDDLAEAWSGGGVLVREARFAGHEVAVVCAGSPEEAEEAVRALAATCEWEILPHVLDPRAGLAEGAPRVEETGNAVGGGPETYERGDVEAALARADVVVEEEFLTSTCLHNALETHGSVAWWEGEVLQVETSTQHVFGVRRALAEQLGLPLGGVRVRSRFMGGGFGAKNGAGKQDLVAALLARETGRPVRFILDRREENLCAGNRPASRQRLRLGARADGKLVAIDFEAWTAVGAWAGGGMPVAGPCKSLYDCADVRTVVHHVRTHTGPQSAFRAPGYVEGTFALEQGMDLLAGRLDLDPLELRRLNEAARDPVSGTAYTSKGLGEAMNRAREAFGWGSREERRDDGDGRIRRGFGAGLQIWGGGGGPPAYATVKIQPDGAAILRAGTQDLGTGTRTVLHQVAAEELGLRADRIRVEIGDTDHAYAPLSAGSMTVASVAPAVRAACAEARRDLLEIGGEILERDPGELDLRDGIFSAGGKRLAEVEEVLERLGNVMIFGRGSRGPNPEGRTINTFACHLAQVAVDTWTGRITIERYVAAHDSGRILNPLTAGSQVLGGIVQGAAGFALMEERALDPASGIVLDPGLEAYRVPTIADAPEVEVLWIDPGDTECNPLGAKGVGEPPIIPAPAAVANAVADALGVRLREAPMAPWRVLEALHPEEDAGEEEAS